MALVRGWLRRVRAHAEPLRGYAMGEPHGAGGFVDLKLGHYSKDGIEVVDVEGEIDICAAPRLRGLLIDLASKNSYQLVINLDKAGFVDSAGPGVLAGGLYGCGRTTARWTWSALQDFGTQMPCSLCATPGERNPQGTPRAA